MIAAGNEVKPGHEGRAAGFKIMLRGLDVFHGRTQGRVVFQGIGQRRFGTARQGLGQGFGGRHVFRWLFADNAHIACRHVVQIGVGGGQIDVSQRQAARRLIDVDPLANAGIGTAAQLLVGRLVLQIVFFGQLRLGAETHDIEPGPPGFEGGVFRGVEQFKIAHQLGAPQALDFAGGGKAVENHLPQAQRLLVTVIRLIDPRLLLLGRNPSRPGRQIDLGKETATRHADFLFRFAEGVPASLHIRAFDHRCLRGILEGHDLLRTRQRRQSEKHAQQQRLADKIHAFRSFSIDSVRSIFYKQMLILDYISL